MKPALRFAVVLLMAAMSSLAFGQGVQDKFFDSNGVRIRYIEQGSGEPVILVHGFTGTLEKNWVAPGVFQQLAKNFRVIALDCRGHGKSDKPHDAKQYGPEMGLDIIRLLDHLKIEKAHIVGYSMGAMITAKLLTIKTDRFLTATLGGAGGLLDPTEQQLKLLDQLAADMGKGSLRTLILMLTPPGQPSPTEEYIKQREETLLAGQDIAALAALSRSNIANRITAAQVAVINIPTLALIGTADPLIQGVNKLKTAMPKLKVVPIEGATHVAAFGRPEFIEALQEFLKANVIKK
jgi:pimeloyl-ACP methyl ester carboxylesterase